MSNECHRCGLFNCRCLEEEKRPSSNTLDSVVSECERLAAYAHGAWSGWMKYMFEKSSRDELYGWVMIPSALVERWTRQMNTDYEDLPEQEKESDRKEADRMLEIIGG